MKTTLQSLLGHKCAVFTTDESSDFFQKATLIENSGLDYLGNVKQFTGFNAVQSEIIVLLFQLLISLLQPQFGDILQNLLFDLTIMLIILFKTRFLIELQLRRVSPESLFLLLLGYLFRTIVTCILLPDYKPFYALMMLLQLHPWFRVISGYCSPEYMNILNFKYLLLPGVLFPLCYQKAQDPQQESLNSTSEFLLQIQVLSIILYYWLEYHFNSQMLDKSILDMQHTNFQLIKSLEENEVHGAQLVHELRNPLNSMMGSITLLEKTLPVKTQQSTEVLSVAKCCGEHLHTLIGNLLEFSKLKAKKVELNKGQVDLRQNVRKIVKMNYFKAKEKNNLLKLFVSQNFPKKVVADEQRINQILINLISNAIKFTDKGAVSVYLGWRPFTTPSQLTLLDGGDSDRSHTQQLSMSMKYQEEKYLFKNLCENPADDASIDHQTSMGSLSKHESKNEYSRYTSIVHYDQLRNYFEPPQSSFQRSQSDHKTELQSARVILENLRTPKNRINEQAVDQEQDNPDDTRENLINLGQFTMTKGHTTTFLYNKGQNTTFQMEDGTYDDKIQEALEQVDNNQREDSNKFKEIDDFLFDQQEHQDHKEVENNQIDFQNEMDVYLLQDENVSAREFIGQNVRHSIAKKDMANNMEQSNDNQNWRVNINYGTPPSNKQGSVRDMSEQDRNIIERVVSKHRTAQSSFVNAVNDAIQRHNSDDLSSLKDGSLSTRRDMTLQSNLDQMDRTHRFNTKFLTVDMRMDPQFQFSLNGSNSNDSKQEEEKMRSRSLNSANVDDNELLMKSLQNAKKYQSPKKRESHQLLIQKNKISVQDLDRLQSGIEEHKIEKELILDNLNMPCEYIDIGLRPNFDSVTQIDPQLLSFNKSDLKFLHGSQNDFDKSEDLKKSVNSILPGTTNSTSVYQNANLFTPSLGPVERGSRIMQVSDLLFNKGSSDVYSDSPIKTKERMANLVFPNSSPLTKITEEGKETLTTNENNQTLPNDSGKGQFGKSRAKTQKKLNIMIQELDKEDQGCSLPAKQNTVPVESLGLMGEIARLNLEQQQEPLPLIVLKQDKTEPLQNVEIKKPTPGSKRLDFLASLKKNNIYSQPLADLYQQVEPHNKLILDNIQENSENMSDKMSSNQFKNTQLDPNNMSITQSNSNSYYQPNVVKRYSTMCLNGYGQSNSDRQAPDTSNNSLNIYGDKGVLEIRVVDQGIGISQDAIKKLFKPYIQADKTIQKNYGGTGLGLCICHELISIMNGKIDVTSQLGKGTEFTVTLPLEISNEVTTYVEESEFDKEMSEIDLMNYEFTVCNNQSSFGIQQIKKNFLKNRNCNIYIKEVHEFLTIGQKNSELFKQEKTYKAFIVDYQSIRNSSQNLLQLLSNHNDQIKFDSNLNSPSLLANQPPAQKLFTIKVPVIVLISPFLDESRVKKSENIFVLRIPFDARSMKKILIFLKRYYQNHIQQIIQKQYPHHQRNDTQISKQDSNITHTLSQELKHMSSDQSKNQKSSKVEKGDSVIVQTLQVGDDNLLSQSVERQCSSQSVQVKGKEGNEENKGYWKGLDSQRLLICTKNISDNSKNNSTTNIQDEIQRQKQDTPDSSRSKIPSARSSRPNGQLIHNPFAISKKKPLKNVLETTFSSMDQKCLVVNDDQFSLKITSMLLELAMNEQGRSFTILNASNGQEALELYQNTTNIKLILMDIEMPQMDGYEATKRIREYEEDLNGQRDNGNMAFIIGVSGNAHAQHFRHCQQVGMNEAVTIPIPNTKINELVSKLFS